MRSRLLGRRNQREIQNAINPSGLLIAEIFKVVFNGRRVIYILLLAQICDIRTPTLKLIQSNFSLSWHFREDVLD